MKAWRTAVGRWPVVLSTVAAMLIIGAGVTAQPERSAWPGDLESLRSDLGFQIRSAFRFHVPERDRRLAEMRTADSAWEASGQTADDRRVMAAWLRGAIAASMPGSRVPMPALPVFEQPRPAAPVEKSVRSEAAIAEPVAPRSATEPVEEPVRVVVQSEPAPRPTPPQARPTTVTQTTPLPFRERQAVKPTPRRVASIQKRRVSEPGLLVSRIAPPAPQEVPVNLPRLTVRTATYHDLLDRIGRALGSPEAWTADQAERLADWVQQAESDYRFVELYYGVLRTEERTRVLRPRSPGSLLERARVELARWEARQDRDFLRPVDSGR